MTQVVTSSERTRSKLEASLLLLGQNHSVAASGALASLQRSALERFTASGLPSRKDEAFRFSPMGVLAEQTVQLGTPAKDFVAVPLEPKAAQLTLINALPATVRELPAGVRVVNLREIVADATLLSKLGTLVTEQDGWVAANTAGFVDGYVIVVEDGAQVSQPLELTFVQVASTTTVAVLPRVLVVLGKGSRFELIERHLSSGQAVSLSNAVVEVLVGDDASLIHSRWVELGDGAHSLCAMAVSVGAHATYQGWSLASSGHYVRHDLQVRLSGRGATAKLDGLYYGRANQLVDSHVRVWHEQPEGSTKECYRGVIENQGRAVFDGIIYVCKGAMKTDARQENRNLLLGPEAVVNTKPHLEIDADDVSCSHGATVGQLDEEQLFYLQARGIDEGFGRQLLTWAFAKEIVDRCPNEAVKTTATLRLEGKLSEDLEGEALTC